MKQVIIKEIRKYGTKKKKNPQKTPKKTEFLLSL